MAYQVRSLRPPPEKLRRAARLKSESTVPRTVRPSRAVRSDLWSSLTRSIIQRSAVIPPFESVIDGYVELRSECSRREMAWPPKITRPTDGSAKSNGFRGTASEIERLAVPTILRSRPER